MATQEDIKSTEGAAIALKRVFANLHGRKTSQVNGNCNCTWCWTVCVCVFVVSILWRHSTLGSKMGSEMEEAEQGNQEGKING